MSVVQMLVDPSNVRLLRDGECTGQYLPMEMA